MSDHVPCSRCERLGQQCEVSQEYRRQNKRRRINDSQSGSFLASGVENSNDGSNNYTFVPSIFGPAPSSPKRSVDSSDPTSARSLDTFKVEADTIDMIFSEFFARQHRYLDILDPNVSPNACYEQSTFLFWALIGIGSQAVNGDPTLSLFLPPKVSDLAMESLKYRDSYLDSIKGLLLLLTWPMTAGCPADTSFTMAGAFMR